MALELIADCYDLRAYVTFPSRWGNRRDHGRSHLELILAVFDSMPPGDPVEVGGGRPDFDFFVLEHEQSHRPVEPGIGIGGDELRPERRIAEYEQHRRLKLYSGLGGELRLIDFAEEPDALVGNVLFQPLDRLTDPVAAPDPHDALVCGSPHPPLPSPQPPA